MHVWVAYKNILQFLIFYLSCNGERKSRAGRRFYRRTNISQLKATHVKTISEPRADSLNFIQSMLMQLTIMAKKDNFDVLAYLIDMAYIECSETIKNGDLQDNKPSVDKNKRHGTA